MKKSRLFWQPRNFLPAKVSDNKVFLLFESFSVIISYILCFSWIISTRLVSRFPG